ncbi:MAG: MFS transporter [bacterium]
MALFPYLGYQNLFLFAFVPGVIAVAAIFFVKEAKEMKKEMHREHYHREPKIEIPSLRASVQMLPKNLKTFIFISALFGLVNFGYAFLLLKAKSVGASDHRAILYYVLFYGVYTLISAPAGIISDRIGRKKMLWIAYSLFLVVTL